MMSPGFIKTKGCGPHEEMLISGILSAPGRCACATSVKSNTDYFCLILECGGGFFWCFLGGGGGGGGNVRGCAGRSTV